MRTHSFKQTIILRAILRFFRLLLHKFLEIFFWKPFELWFYKHIYCYTKYTSDFCRWKIIQITGVLYKDATITSDKQVADAIQKKESLYRQLISFRETLFLLVSWIGSDRYGNIVFRERESQMFRVEPSHNILAISCWLIFSRAGPRLLPILLLLHTGAPRVFTLRFIDPPNPCNQCEVGEHRSLGIALRIEGVSKRCTSLISLSEISFLPFHPRKIEISGCRFYGSGPFRLLVDLFNRISERYVSILFWIDRLSIELYRTRYLNDVFDPKVADCNCVAEICINWKNLVWSRER